MTVSFGGLTLDWLGYATVRIESEDGTVVYLDPGRYSVLDDYDGSDGSSASATSGDTSPLGDGDAVLVTHDHHYDSDGVRRVANDDATVVAYEAVDATNVERDVDPVEDLPYDTRRVGETESFSVAGVDVRTLPAYNDPDGPHVDVSGEPHHPRSFGVGFSLTVDGVTLLWPGDSDVIDEHEDFDPDVFVPPIGGSFTMDRHGAADLAEALDPELTFPVHYDTFEALETDSRSFAADVASRSVPVVLDGPDDY
jgi:L-ascorbate metabolism protein UlaG (beta-lactamase superfamily)